MCRVADASLSKRTPASVKWNGIHNIAFPVSVLFKQMSVVTFLISNVVQLTKFNVRNSDQVERDMSRWGLSKVSDSRLYLPKCVRGFRLRIYAVNGHGVINTSPKIG